MPGAMYSKEFPAFQTLHQDMRGYLFESLSLAGAGAGDKNENNDRARPVALKVRHVVY